MRSKRYETLFHFKDSSITNGLQRKPYFDESTMIVGVDVSHAAPGTVDMASMAAMTVSLDKTCSRYGAAIQSNGHRVEMIESSNIHML